MAKTIPEIPESLVINDNTQYVMDSGTQTFKVKGSTLRAYFSAAIQNTIDTVILPALSRYKNSFRALLAGNWSTQGSQPVTNYVTAIAYSPMRKFFWAVSKYSGTQKHLTSIDGKNWTVSPYTTINKVWEDMCYAPALDMFCAVTSDTTNLTQIITWGPSGGITGRTSAILKAIYSVCWSPELNLFVAVGNLGLVQTSPNGVNWTVQTSAIGTAIFRKVIWSPGLGLFFAFEGSAITRYMTSPDGTTWTERTLVDPIAAEAITWSEEKGMLLAVSSGSAYRSTDGLAWESSPIIYNPLEIESPYHAGFQAVCWSPELGVFMATGINNYDFCAYSENGFDWQFNRLSGDSSPFWRVFWFSAFGFFIACSKENGAWKFATSLKHKATV